MGRGVEKGEGWGEGRRPARNMWRRRGRGREGRGKESESKEGPNSLFYSKPGIPGCCQVTFYEGWCLESGRMDRWTDSG